jgi:hypothetical protein
MSKRITTTRWIWAAVRHGSATLLSECLVKSQVRPQNQPLSSCRAITTRWIWLVPS